MNIITQAKAFAEKVHAGQTRKYSGRPYIEHPRKVARMLANMQCSEELIAAGWLHDVLEDTSTTYNELENLFGTAVAEYVFMVTHPSVIGNRKERWVKYLDHYSKASSDGKILKMVDRICNLRETIKDWDLLKLNDKKFMKDVYLQESDDLFKNLSSCNDIYWNEWVKLKKHFMEWLEMTSVKKSFGELDVSLDSKEAHKCRMSSYCEDCGHHNIMEFTKEQLKELNQTLSEQIYPNMVENIIFKGVEITPEEIKELYQKVI